MKTRYVDFDGTLAYFDGWKGYKHLGEPVPTMLEKVRCWLEAGDEVVIFTARIGPWACPKMRAEDPVDTEDAIRLVQDWTERHLGKRLEVTAHKGSWDHCYDDSIQRVVRNTGLTLQECFVEKLREFNNAWLGGTADGCAHGELDRLIEELDSI